MSQVSNEQQMEKYGSIMLLLQQYSDERLTQMMRREKTWDN